MVLVCTTFEDTNAIGDLTNIISSETSFSQSKLTSLTARNLMDTLSNLCVAFFNWKDLEIIKVE